MSASLEHRLRMLAFQKRQQDIQRQGAIPMQTRTYTEKSNARRAAKAAGVDPNLVIATEDGFTFPMPAEEAEPNTTSGHDQAGNGTDPEASAEQMKAAHAEDERDVEIAEERLREIEDHPGSLVSGDALQERLDELDTNLTKDNDGIPAFCKVDPEERKAEWARNPPKAAPAPIKETPVAKTSKAKAKSAKTKGAKSEKATDKTAMLLAMLKGKGSTVEAMTEALGWLPHTLRARISRLHKPKSKGGDGLKIERERVNGVTTYRIVL